MNNLRLRNHRSRATPSARHQGAAYYLFESVVAMTAATVALAILAPMFARQIEMARRARDTDQLEAVVNKDLNSLRQITRFWRMRSGPATFLDSTITTVPYVTPKATSSTAQTYNNPLNACQAKTNHALAFMSDIGNITNLSKSELKIADPELNNPPNIFGQEETLTLPSSLAKRYTLKRTMSQGSTGAYPAIRINYTIEKEANSPDLVFQRQADIQLEAQYWC